MSKYYVVEFPDWIHVVAITSHGQMVLVRQYRHAAQEWFLEVPGGSMDPQSGESAEQAALRELAEETGYVPRKLVFLGSHRPNPALQSNTMHTYLALDCRQEKLQQLDPYEELVVELHSIPEIYSKMDRGEIQHSLMVASLALARSKLLPEIK